ncbi:MAG TPA: hypothetical protein VMK05_04740, partial [Burkholderiales bacterium]|nr:hypothetical protein [Burkholderiales bacterium]
MVSSLRERDFSESKTEKGTTMNFSRCITRIVMIAGLASTLALVPAQAAESVENIEGVIMSRDGDKLVLRGAGLGVTNVTITRSTAI